MTTLLELCRIEPPASRSKEDLRVWLLKYPDRPIEELTMFLHRTGPIPVGPMTLRRWRRNLGLNPKPDSMKAAQEAARKVGNKCRATSFDYRNREWLYKHYIEMHETSEAMARSCNVNPQTIVHWLTRYRIDTRLMGEGLGLPNAVRVPLEMCDPFKLGGRVINTYPTVAKRAVAGPEAVDVKGKNPPRTPRTEPLRPQDLPRAGPIRAYPQVVLSQKRAGAYLQ